jgi:hypothetical protein
LLVRQLEKDGASGERGRHRAALATQNDKKKPKISYFFFFFFLIVETPHPLSSSRDAL